MRRKRKLRLFLQPITGATKKCKGISCCKAIRFVLPVVLILMMQRSFCKAWRTSSPFLRTGKRPRLISGQNCWTSTASPWSKERLRTAPRTSALSLAGKRSSSSSSWTIGDAVLIDKHNDRSRLVPGIIEEIRGSGWYNIRLKDPPQEIQKVRGNQLIPSSTTLMESSPPRDDTSPEADRLLEINYEELPEAKLQAPPPLTAEIDSTNVHPVDPSAPPPPPKIDDLDALLRESVVDAAESDLEYLRQVKHHTSIAQWVVFTDLHCAPSTLDTTLQVLQVVHQMAQERGAGVLFLGDFWHHRGTLRVDCLNAVLKEFRNWSVPMVMIPGNHDQVTLGGHSHGLTPLEYSYRVQSTVRAESVAGPLVLSHPTLFAGALFVPHIRDIAILESILQSHTAKTAKAVLVHADVTGAYMNDMIVSTGGVHPSVFPAHKPIYSGHFHKPHIVTHNNNDVVIEYLGSPYETSLAEAQQQKALVVLDATRGWKCVERIPMSIGRKHYKPDSIADFMAFTTVSSNSKTLVKAGDRVVLTLPRKEVNNLEAEVNEHIQKLRKAGVAVEVREATDASSVTAMASKDTMALEELTPVNTWNQFWKEQVERGVVDQDEADVLRKAGLKILDELETSDDDSKETTSTASTGSALLPQNTDLQLDSVTVEGYGPFPETVNYPLHDRGLVLLKGTNLDGGSDSNGSGKTSLAMAALWALTGSADPRPFQDNKVADVVNDYKQNARVTLHGELNGKPFAISRTKTPKKSGLSFILDGQDLTTQSAKETMILIEEKLGISPSVLARTMFHGQHSLNDLLEATDTKLKEELALIVPLQLWQAAVAHTRSKGRDATKKGNELQGMVSLRTEDLEKLKKRRDAALNNLHSKEEELRSKEAELTSQYEEQTDSDSDQLRSFGSLQQSLAEVNARVKNLENEINTLREERKENTHSNGTKLAGLLDLLSISSKRHQEVYLEYRSACNHRDNIKARIESLERTWQVDLSTGEIPADFHVPDNCPTCGQDVSKEPMIHGEGHLHRNLQSVAEEEIGQMLQSLSLAQTKLESAQTALQESDRQQQEIEEEVNEFRKELASATVHWDDRLSELESKLRQSREEQRSLSDSFAEAATLLHEGSSAESSMESQLTSERDAVLYAKDTFHQISKEVEGMEDSLKTFISEMTEQQNIAREMASLSDAFGNRGIQTYVLQNAVNDLQTTTQSYLDDFSDGAQRLQLELDAGDRISRRAFVREPDGSYKERPLATLSGGQWRRCSLALTLGFADLVARRGRLRPSLMVLDEPLTHLDRAGRTDVGKVLRKLLGRMDKDHTHQHISKLSLSTIIIILQDLAAEELEEAFDRIDEVIKKDGKSSVKVDETVVGET